MRENRRQRSSGYRFFLAFCVTLCLLTIVSVIGVAMIYRPELGHGIIAKVRDTVPFLSGESETGSEPKVTGKDRRNGVHTVLVAGTDYDGTRTDTMLLATIDTKVGNIHLMSIPRDTRAFMENGNVHTINAAHNKGSERMMTEVTATVGFRPDHYVVLDYGDFEKIIDAIGGVDVDVPMDIYYIADDMVFDLQAGQQTLNGEQALMYMRYREGYPDADLGRIRAQQTVFLSLAQKMMSAKTLFSAPKLAKIFFDDVETDYKLSEVIWLGIQCLSMDAANLSVDRLPGHASGADYVVDEADALTLINEKYNPYSRPITSLNIAE